MRRTVIALATVATLTLAGCGGDDDPLATTTPDATDSDGGDALTVGSADFTENVLLAEIYAGALEGIGREVDTQLRIGAREAYIPALESGEIDLIPEYTGNLRLYLDPDATGSTSEEVYFELASALPEGLAVLKQSAAEDKDSVVVTAETAEANGLVEIGDLAPVAGDLVLGGPPEWKTRQTGLPGLEELYGVTFGDYRELDPGGPLTLNALLNGQIDAGNLFSTNPSIATEGLVVLEDPKSLFAAQNVVPLLRTEVADDEVTEALNAVSAALDTEVLTELVSRVDIDQEDPEDVAADFLAESDLG